MDNERTVVMTEREPQVGETEHPTSGSLDTCRRANFKGSRADEGGELGLALRLYRSRSERSDAYARPLEDTARTVLESCTGRTFSDVEWARARTRLLEFVTILRGWEGKAKTPGSGLGNVV